MFLHFFTFVLFKKVFTFSAARFSAPRSCWIPWVWLAIASVKEPHSGSLNFTQKFMHPEIITEVNQQGREGCKSDESHFERFKGKLILQSQHSNLSGKKKFRSGIPCTSLQLWGRGRSWGLLTQDTGSITRLSLATNEGRVAVTVAFSLVCPDNAESWLADTYFGSSYWLAQHKAALEGKSSLRFLLPIFNYLPPFLVFVFQQQELMSHLDKGTKQLG